MQKMIAGVDLGAGLTKAVLLDPEKRVLANGSAKTRADFRVVAETLLDEMLRPLGAERRDLAYVATTGLGRYALPGRDIQITEITCGAKGAVFLYPGTRTVLDIGAQSSRAVKLQANGRVRSFASNEKCAAGSGGFLEKAAKYLEIQIEKMGTLSLVSSDPQKISSICAVLAESEIISHLSDGRKVEDIVRGVYDSLAGRAATLLKRVGLEEELTFIGGVGLQEGMIACVQEKVGVKMNVPREPESVPALGAALLALERWRRRQCEETARTASSSA